MNEALQILALLGLAAVALGLLWPRTGLLARLRPSREPERVRVEDALKHLHAREYEARPCTPEDVAGSLGLPLPAAVELVARLEARGLARSSASGTRLTEDGRAYALRVLRSHRLWERYLADETGVSPGEWHAQADRREHTLTAAEAESLAARLGQPLYDPHGDPIPTAGGWVPPRKGVPLSTLTPGEVARVLHVEDEPREVYERLVAQGLAPQVEVEAVGADERTVRFRAAGREHEIEPVVAAGIAVEPLDPAEAVQSDIEPLSALRLGESADVVRISPASQGVQRRRLLDLGVVPGTHITAELTSMSGDPVGYRIRGAIIALRRDQAEWVLVRRQAQGVEI